MITLELARTALLVMDYQAEIVAMLGDKAAGPLERTAGLVAAARRVGIRVIYVVVGFRPGYPEVSPRNQAFAALVQSGRFRGGGPPGADISPAVAPADGEVVVTKHRVSAFAGTDLDMILRAHGVDTLVLTGFATSGVVLSTLRHAADADYRLVVVEDACADGDDEVHGVLTQKVFRRQATVTTAAELLPALG
jgi:nicotinamidase-related amidase